MKINYSFLKETDYLKLMTQFASAVKFSIFFTFMCGFALGSVFYSGWDNNDVGTHIMIFILQVKEKAINGYEWVRYVAIPNTYSVFQDIENCFTMIVDNI